MSDRAGWTVLAASWLSVLLAVPAPTPAAEYYVCPSGDDQAVGDRESPWQSLAQVNVTLQPGDTAVFLPGEYSGTISPAQQGTAEAPITYRAAQPWGARLVPANGRPLIALDGQRHVTIDGFYLDAQEQTSWVQATDCHYLTIRGCKMRRARRHISITHSSQIRLLDNLFSADRVMGDMMWLEECDRILVEGNSFTRIGHSPFTLNYCNHAVMRANVFRAEWGRNYITYSLGRVLWEGNIITRARDSGGSASSRAHSFWDDGIFRYNRVYGNLGAPLNMGSYIWQGVSPTGRFRGPFGTRNSRFYHNTFVDNVGEAWLLGGIVVSSNVFQNNIFYRNDWTGSGIQLTRAEGISRDNRFVHNLFRGNQPDQPVVRYGSHWWTAEEANANTPTTGGFWSEFHGNFDGEPGFRAADQRDYWLAPGSPAIDAGAPLARAVGNGSGRQLPVNDGRSFYDGFGIDGEQGDTIAIGSQQQQARIERVELRYHQPAILHLDRETSWQDGMPVSLPWTGEAPDLGAYPAGDSHPTRIVALARPAEPEPGQAIQFSLDTLGKTPESVHWDFENGTYSDQLEPQHSYPQPGHFGVTVRVNFSDGSRAVDALFVRVAKPDDPEEPLIEADFEPATRKQVWGYQFKFYRGHQTGYADVPRPDGEGRCLRLFFDANKQNRTAAQFAPGVWDLERHPHIRFEYRIPEGVPVAVAVETFPAPGQPRGFLLATTQEHRPGPYQNLQGPTLKDDGQWHAITLDARQIRTAAPKLRYLARFLFHTDWREDQGQEFWFDNFAILPQNGTGSGLDL